MDRFFHPNRFAWKLIAALIFFSSLVTLVTTAVQMYSEYDRDIEAIESRFQQVERSYKNSISENVWEADSERLELLVSGIIEFPDFSYAVVRDENGDALASAGTEVKQRRIRKSYPLHYTFRGNLQKIGELEVAASLTGVYDRLLSRIWLILISNTIKTFLVALFLFVVIHWLLTRHLDAMAAFARKMNLDLPMKPLQLDRGFFGGKRDEVDILAGSLNDMQRRLVRAAAKRKQNEEKIQELNEDLERRIKDRSAALRDSAQQFRTVADNLPASIGYYDMEERLQFINKEIVRQLAKPTDEIIGTPIRELFSAENYAKLRPRYDVVMAGQEIRFEETIDYPDGVTREVDMAYIPDFDEDGKQKGWFALVQDITERKRLEQVLLRNERLAAMGHLTGTVAHELRNPLGAIATSVSVIRHRATEANLDLGGTLERVERSIARCDKIVTELLDFARAKGLQPGPAALDGWLSDVLAEQEIPAGVEVQCNFGTDGTVLEFDQDELRRAVINVIDNACQAMTEDGGQNHRNTQTKLAVSTRKAGERVEIVLKDTGPGISPEDLPQVMEPLYSTKAFGTGLGLPTVQRIMEEHGGGIEIDSARGDGTQVVLWLPADGCEIAASQQNTLETRA